MSLDIKLLGKAIQCHGLGLVDKIKEEQQTEPSSSMMSYLDRRRPVETEEKNEMFMDVVRSFIARKSDMLFKPVEASGDEPKSDGEDKEEVADVYAIMPPLESFMSVPSSFRRDHFYDSLRKEDCVTGVVTSVLDTGLLVRLLCVDVGPPRDMDGLDVTAYCPAKELPRLYAKEIALDAFQENDIVRGIVLSVNPESERIILSLHEKSIPQEKTYPRIGLITEEEFPVHYRRKSEAKNKDYEDILESVMGFNNVGNIKALVQQQGFTEIQSFTRSLSRLTIPKMEYAEGLNKWQSERMAHQSVALGVGMFKDGKYMEAMQHFNKALQIHNENVEALVARGALFANKESFEKAVADFRQALSINSTHSNARNYLIETLLTMGKLQEDGRHLAEAYKHYEEVLEIDPDHTEAKDMLAGCQKLMAFQETSHTEGKSLDRTKGKGLSHSSDDSDSDMDVDPKSKKKSAKAQSSASILSKSTEKLLQLIKEDESKMGRSKKKRKHKRSRDHSSSEKEEPKKRKKRRTSSRGERTSSSDSDSPDRRKGKSQEGRMRSPSPGTDGNGSIRIKDKTASFQESHWATSRLQSPTGPRSSGSFLPFSSNRFFDKSTIPGLGSPPPSDAHVEDDKDVDGRKSLQEARLSSPGIEKDSGSRPQLSRRDSYLMEQRKKFYEKETEKAPSPKRKQRRKRSSSSSSSRSSSSSSSSSDGGNRKGRGRRRRSESSSPTQRRRRRSSRTRSRSMSRSSSKSQTGSYKVMGSVKKRTGVAELDMYLGGGSSSEAIMALLGYGSKASKRSPSDPQNSRLRSKSPVKWVTGSRRSESRSPVSRRDDRSLSRSSGGNRQNRLDRASSHSRRKSRSRSKSRESQHGPPRTENRTSLERKLEGHKKDVRMVERNRPRIDGLEKDREADGRVKSEKEVQQRGDVRRDTTVLSGHQKLFSGDGDVRSWGLKDVVKPQSRPFLPRVLRKPAMDDPELAQRTISSKEYDAYLRDKKQTEEQSKAMLENEKSGKSRVKKETVDKKSRDTGTLVESRTKSSKRKRQGSRKDRRESGEGHQNDHLEWEEASGSREKNQNVPRREREKFDTKNKSDQREKSKSDGRNDQGDRSKSDGRNDPSDRSKSDGRNDQGDRSKSDGRNDPRDRSKSDGRNDPRDSSKSDGRNDPRDRSKSDRRNDPRDIGKSDWGYDPRHGGKFDERNDQRDGGKSDGRNDPSDRSRSDERFHLNYRDKSDGRNDPRGRNRSDGRNDPRPRGRSDERTDLRERSQSGEKDDIPSKRTILMAQEDLEKEIERRVQERLKEEEKKEKEKKAKEGSQREGEEEAEEEVFYVEDTTGWTKDAFGQRYYGLKGKKLPVGYHKDKFGKTYFVGVNPVTLALAESQTKLNPPKSYEEDYRGGKSVREFASPNRRDSGEWEKSVERERDYHVFGRSSLSSSRGSAREDKAKDIADERRWQDSHEKTSEPHFKSKRRSEHASDDRGSMSRDYNSRRRQRTDESRDYDLPSTSSTSKEPARKQSKWDEEGNDSRGKMDEISEAKLERKSKESLTDLEKFLSSLKQRKKQQWIAEGKIKEKE